MYTVRPFENGSEADEPDRTSNVEHEWPRDDAGVAALSRERLQLHLHRTARSAVLGVAQCNGFSIR